MKALTVTMAIAVLAFAATVSCTGPSYNNTPSPNTNAGTSSPQNANTVESKLQGMRENIKSNGMSFQVGDTGLLSTPLKELTGGQKVPFSPDEARELEEQLKEAERKGLVPSASNFNLVERDVTLRDVQPPFDWQEHVGKAAFDWRSYRTITPPKRQEGCGACWAFAAASMLEANNSIFFKRQIDVSEQDIINCSEGGCGGGLLHSGLKTLKNRGAAAESDLGYQGVKQPCSTTVRKCYQVAIHGFVDPNWGTPEMSRMKQYIYQWGGVGVFMIATDTMLGYTGGVYDEFATSGENHFVVILGWDDNKVHRRGKGAWLIKNSWGTGWGEGGFGWVAYGANEIGFNAQMSSPNRPAAGCP